MDTKIKGKSKRKKDFVDPSAHKSTNYTSATKIHFELLQITGVLKEFQQKIPANSPKADLVTQLQKTQQNIAKNYKKIFIGTPAQNHQQRKILNRKLKTAFSIIGLICRPESLNASDDSRVTELNPALACMTIGLTKNTKAEVFVFGDRQEKVEKAPVPPKSGVVRKQSEISQQVDNNTDQVLNLEDYLDENGQYKDSVAEGQTGDNDPFVSDNFSN